MTLRPGEQPTNWVNVAKFVLSRPSRLPVLARKVIKRLRGESTQGSPENDAWLAANSVSAEEIARPLDSKLWDEAEAFGSKLEEHARKVFKHIEHDLGGGGDYRFLYWLTRYRRPNVVLETGVAAGWSSAAMLTAMKKNRKGRLYSSDLPMFRLPNPERFVGILVEPELRENWVLELDGDEANLPRILEQIDQIDILHYDSDKMASGRNYAIDLLKPRLANGGIILMDDIFNDDWFRNYVTASGVPFKVVNREYGIIGKIARPSPK